MNPLTLQQYNGVFDTCRDVFIKKNRDYGTSWRSMRTSSITDQIFIKAKRIKSIEEKGEQKVADSIEGDYAGIVNYCIIALIQLELGDSEEGSLEEEKLITLYDKNREIITKLMLDKNHDYGEAWRDMRLSTITDMIMMRVMRIRQIEDNKGQTVASEGIDANYYDMVNYAIFALIRLKD